MYIYVVFNKFDIVDNLVLQYMQNVNGIKNIDEFHGCLKIQEFGQNNNIKINLFLNQKYMRDQILLLTIFIICTKNQNQKNYNKGSIRYNQILIGVMLNQNIFVIKRFIKSFLNLKSKIDSPIIIKYQFKIYIFTNIIHLFESLQCNLNLPKNIRNNLFRFQSYQLDTQNNTEVIKGVNYQLTTKKLPVDQSCLPCLEVNSTLGGIMKTLIVEQGYATKSNVQIFVQSDQIQIVVFNKKLAFIPKSNLSKVIYFTITIIDSPPERYVCIIPTYGQDSQQDMEEIETETTTILIVPQNSWNCAYYIWIIIIIKSKLKVIGQQLKQHYYQLIRRTKQFYHHFSLIYSYQARMVIINKLIYKERLEIQFYFFAVGIYNLNEQVEITLTFHKQSEDEED